MTPVVRLLLSAALVGLVAPTVAPATPCTAFRQAAADASLDRAVGSQLAVADVHVVDSFRDGAWRLVYATSAAADPAVLFYAGSPLHDRYRAVWSGAARIDEAQQLRRWAGSHAPGIPARLAACFAWYVTQGRSQ